MANHEEVERMISDEQPERYGARGLHRKVIDAGEGKGYRASSKTENRKPPQGGSGTAPPKNANKDTK